MSHFHFCAVLPSGQLAPSCCCTAIKRPPGCIIHAHIAERECTHGRMRELIERKREGLFLLDLIKAGCCCCVRKRAPTLPERVFWINRASRGGWQGEAARRCAPRARARPWTQPSPSWCELIKPLARNGGAAPCTAAITHHPPPAESQRTCSRNLCKEILKWDVLYICIALGVEISVAGERGRNMQSADICKKRVDVSPWSGRGALFPEKREHRALTPVARHSLSSQCALTFFVNRGYLSQVLRVDHWILMHPLKYHAFLFWFVARILFLLNQILYFWST